ncbi:MAG: hypothetical protein ABL998_00870 [Planctomycetota bacterium]
MKLLLLTIPLLLGSCASGQTRDERLESVAWEFADAALTLRDLAPIYQTERPELAERIVGLAVDLERVARAVEAVRGGTMGSGTALETLDDVLELAAQTWPDEPDVQAGLVLARAALRRAERELGVARPVDGAEDGPR